MRGPGGGAGKEVRARDLPSEGGAPGYDAWVMRTPRADRGQVPKRAPLPKHLLILRVIGCAALAAAIALGGFMAYQLWFTNVQADRAQPRLADEFAVRAQAAEPSTATYQPGNLPLAPIVIPSALDDAAGLEIGVSLVRNRGRTSSSRRHRISESRSAGS